MADTPAFPSRDSISDLIWLVDRRTAWVEGGRDPETGLDCLGACLVCAKTRGLPWIDPWEQIRLRWEAGERDIRELAAWPDGWRPVSRAGARRNDVVVFSLERDQVVPGHMGFAIDDGLILSAREGIGVYTHPYSRLRDRVFEIRRYVA